MSQENFEIVWTFYDAFNQGDPAAAAEGDPVAFRPERKRELKRLDRPLRSVVPRGSVRQPPW